MASRCESVGLVKDLELLENALALLCLMLILFADLFFRRSTGSCGCGSSVLLVGLAMHILKS